MSCFMWQLYHAKEKSAAVFKCQMHYFLQDVTLVQAVQTHAQMHSMLSGNAVGFECYVLRYKMTGHCDLLYGFHG